MIDHLFHIFQLTESLSLDPLTNELNFVKCLKSDTLIQNLLPFLRLDNLSELVNLAKPYSSDNPMLEEALQNLWQI